MSAAAAHFDSLTPAQQIATRDILYDWKTWARPEQLEPPGDWFVWLNQSGRGAGKTRGACETIRSRIDAGIWRVVNVAGPTWSDVWDVMVIGTDAAPGLVGVWPPSMAPKLVKDEKNPHLRCHNGAMIRLRAAKQAERFRGPQADGGWCDEIDSWKPDSMSVFEAFENFELGIRLGPDPRILCTSTPKPSGLVRMLRGREDCHVTVSSTYDNKANLSPAFIKMLRARYEGTRRARQELYGELLEDVEDAIVLPEMIEESRVEEAPDLGRIVVAIDPAVTSGEQSDETGITAAGKGVDGHGYLLADRSCRMSPRGWARRALDLADEVGADCIVAEVNNGGDMVEATIRAERPFARVKQVRATRGKHMRFEPIGCRYEQGKIHHVGRFKKLEDQVCSFTSEGYEGADNSPDRADAAVWAFTELFGGGTTWDELYPDMGEEAA